MAIFNTYVSLPGGNNNDDIWVYSDKKLQYKLQHGLLVCPEMEDASNIYVDMHIYMCVSVYIYTMIHRHIHTHIHIHKHIANIPQ